MNPRIVSVKRTEDRYAHIIESDGTERILPPAYFTWMVDKGKGKWAGWYFYSKEMPDNFFEKAARLEAAGYYQGYHYDQWLKPGERDDVGGISTDEAIKEIEGEGK